MNLPEGTDYMVIDPTGMGRNWFMLWARIDVYGRIWVWREWPCSRYAIPGVGYAEAWAISGRSNQNKFGGLPGGGQKGFGFSLADYKDEIARIEGWVDVKSERPVIEWEQRNGADVNVYRRGIDSRFAGNASYTAGAASTTLLEELISIGLPCEPASGKNIDEGLALINDALAYADGYDPQKLDAVQRMDQGPKLFIAESCENLWFALKNYTGLGGQKEATKDPVDCLRYLFLMDPCYVPIQANARHLRAPGGYGSTLSSQTNKPLTKAERWMNR